MKFEIGQGKPKAHPLRVNAAQYGLTPRELSVLQLTALGDPQKMIAHKMGVGIKSIEKYRQSVNDKLNLRSTAKLVHYALHHNLVKNLFAL